MPYPAAIRDEDPSVARAERRLRLLERLTEIGMELAEALHARAMNPAAEAADPNARDPADAYARLSRAIRLTISLESKTDQEMRALQAGAPPAPEAVRPELCEGPRIAADGGVHDVLAMLDNERKADAFDLLVSIAEAETEGLADYEVLCDRLVERMDDDYQRARRPVSMTIERLCADLGLGPDLSHRVAIGFEEGYRVGAPGRYPFRQSSSARGRWRLARPGPEVHAQAAVAEVSRQLE